MKFTIQINSSPYHSSASQTAYQFVKTALSSGHQVLRVFFYHDGIYHALKQAVPPDDEWQWREQWSELAKCHQIDLVVCISAAQRRGLLCTEEMQRLGLNEDNLAEGFRISGLGQLIEAVILADRFIVF